MSGGTISGGTYGIRLTSCTLHGGTLSGNTTGDFRETCSAVGYGTTLASATQYSTYRTADGYANEQYQVVIWDIGGVDGAVKAWMQGGYVESVATQPTNWPGGVDWVESYQHTLQDATRRCWIEKPIYCRKGVVVTVDVYVKHSATGFTERATACLVDMDDTTPAPASALDSEVAADNTDWQKLTLTHTPTRDKQIALRVYGKHASGTIIWREVVTQGGGGGGGSIFGGLIVR